MKGYCESCGVIVGPKRTQKGENKGTLYYTKLCVQCLYAKRCEVAKRNVNYEKFRKHTTKTCVICTKVFDVRGVSNAGRLKTCSAECLSNLRVIHAKKGRFAQTNLTPNLHKSWSKTFEQPQKGDALKLGPSHWRSKRADLVSPQGHLHHVCNVVHFVRSNETLFNAPDVNWIPAKKRSKVVSKGCRPSEAKGCLKCRASQGLMSVASGRRPSWKGWTAKL